ncbi:MAG: metal-dependent hydrolase [Haloarculaceae archaeon]
MDDEAGIAPLSCGFGESFPDLVDKPLAWYLGVLPYGRSLAHSALVGVAVVLAVGVACRRLHRPELGPAFAVGYLSHLLADAVYPALAGDVGSLRFLVWPLVPLLHTDAEVRGVLAQFATIQPTLHLLAGIGLSVAACVLWIADGTPGLTSIASLFRFVSRGLSFAAFR